MEQNSILNHIKSFNKKNIDLNYKEISSNKKSQDIENLITSLENSLSNSRDIEEARDEIRTLRSERLELKDLNEKMVMSMIEMTNQLNIIQSFIQTANENSITRLPVLIQRIEKLYKKILNKSGIYEIESIGEIFNPDEHEYIEQREALVGEIDNQVVEVIKKGYRYESKILVPAQVKIAKK